MTYLYVKKPAKPVRQSRIKKQHLTYFLLIMGIFLLISAVYPILKFQLGYSLRFNQIINPLSTKFYNRSTDYDQLPNWFVSNVQNTAVNSFLQNSDPLSSYHISIPKINIKDAQVDIGSLDLKKSLIQYPQTALPGQPGTTVIFGHSSLPQFFSSKSYLTMFSSLYKLKIGDEIFINFDNIRYKYVVEEIYEVQPSDLSILEQRFDGRNLTLVTCSPPGTVLRRLVVKSSLVDNN